jgi:Helix-hairpin-helix domain
MAKTTAGESKPKRGAGTGSEAPRTRSRGAQAPEDAAAGIPAPRPPERAAAAAGVAKPAKGAKAGKGAAKSGAAAATRRSPAVGVVSAADAPRTRGRTRAAAPSEGPDLRADLRDFVQARPEGWGHDDWLAFLDHLAGRGHDTANADAIGLALERERLAAVLETVQGMGPRRVQTLVDRYETFWSLSHADLDEIAALPGMNRALAEKVKQKVR